MCGIFATRPVVKSWLQSSLLKHSDRGPDQKAIYIEKDIGIAVNRLAITGSLDEGAQPIHSNSGDSLCIFNGAIFNYKEMAKKFNLNPSSKNDGAVLLELYELIGLKVFDFVQGMYAMIIIDRKKNRMVVSEMIYILGYLIQQAYQQIIKKKNIFKNCQNMKRKEK